MYKSTQLHDKWIRKCRRVQQVSEQVLKVRSYWKFYVSVWLNMKDIIKLLGSIRDPYSCLYFNFIKHKYLRTIHWL